jgi:mono/diheme cytochrome c family protein
MNPLPVIVGAALALASGRPVHAPDPQVEAGRIVAERACGGCHAVGEGPSPHPKAPPFRTLGRRGPIDGLLERGMLADHPRALEEGRRDSHPDMPTLRLEPDEIANLVAYLRDLNGED